MALTAYENEVGRLVHDPNFQAYPQATVDSFVNIARSQVAIEAQCCRTLLSGGTITGFTLASGGSGFSTSPALVITGGGNQATGTAQTSGGIVTGGTVTNGGWGYVTGTTTTVTVSGSSTILTANIDHSVETVTGQEVYQFSTWNVLANNQTINPGFNQVVGVFSIAVSQSGTYKPLLTPKVWTEFQAYLRIFQNTQQNYPVYWSQYGQGVNGSVYLYPWPAQPLLMDVDVWCTPIALTSDSTAEAIPYPWTDAIPYYAAYLCYENSSRKEDADRMFKMYTMFMKRGRSMTDSPYVPDYYYGKID